MITVGKRIMGRIRSWTNTGVVPEVKQSIKKAGKF